MGIPQAGARWWKFDFHSHTPSSFDFGGLSEGTAAANPTSWREWLLSYMAAEVDALVVADHNTHEGIQLARNTFEELRAEGSAGFREIAIFAGAELTVDGNYHLLAVFDVTTHAEVVNELLYKVGYQGTRGTSNATTLTTFQAAVRQIHELNGLAIPAHVDQAAGLFKHNAPNIAAVIKDGKVRAAEVTTSAGRTRAEASGWVAVLGSDAHHLDGASCPPAIEPKYPGSHFTWVKMEHPTLEGLRVAFSDGSDSVRLSTEISADPNAFQHSVLERIVVRHGGDETAHTFSPWMNALIGGRGTGKSTLVELVRLALDRFSDLPESLQSDLEWYSPIAGTERIWDASTEVDLYYLRSGQQYRIAWKAIAPATSKIEVNNGSDWVLQEGNARDRFPVLLSSQKQIYETAKDPQSLLTVIDSQPEIDHRGWLEEFRRLSSRYRTERAEVAEFQTQADNRARVVGDMTDLQAEIDLRSKLAGSKEAAELEELIGAETASTQRDEIATAFRSRLGVALAEVDAHVSTDLAEDAWTPEADYETELRRAVQSVRDAVSGLDAARDAWVDVQTASPRLLRIVELREILKPADSENSQAESLSDLLTRRGVLESHLQAIGAADKTLQPAIDRALATLAEIRAHRADLTLRRKKFALLLGDSQLKVEVHAQADMNAMEHSLRDLVRKTTAFESVFGDDGLLKVLVSNSRDPKHLAEVDDLKSLLKDMRLNGDESTRLRSHNLQFERRFWNHLETIDANQFEADVDLWFPSDSLNIRYQDPASGNLINLDQGSPGQKTAALLTLFLQIGNDPLILDQPEDDLDNRLIYDLVVTRLKAAKTTRQVIVVTHNANVVVNADAELVMVMKHSFPPAVERSGSIQNSEVKDDICLIMEGGRVALQSRYGRLMEVG